MPLEIQENVITAMQKFHTGNKTNPTNLGQSMFGVLVEIPTGPLAKVNVTMPNGSHAIVTLPIMNATANQVNGYEKQAMVVVNTTTGLDMGGAYIAGVLASKSIHDGQASMPGNMVRGYSQVAVSGAEGGIKYTGDRLGGATIPDFILQTFSDPNTFAGWVIRNAHTGIYYPGVGGQCTRFANGNSGRFAGRTKFPASGSYRGSATEDPNKIRQMHDPAHSSYKKGAEPGYYVKGYQAIVDTFNAHCVGGCEIIDYGGYHIALLLGYVGSPINNYVIYENTSSPSRFFWGVGHNGMCDLTKWLSRRNNRQMMLVPVRK